MSGELPDTYERSPPRVSAIVSHHSETGSNWPTEAEWKQWDQGLGCNATHRLTRRHHSYTLITRKVEGEQYSPRWKGYSAASMEEERRGVESTSHTVSQGSAAHSHGTVAALSTTTWP